MKLQVIYLLASGLRTPFTWNQISWSRELESQHQRQRIATTTYAYIHTISEASVATNLRACHFVQTVHAIDLKPTPTMTSEMQRKNSSPPGNCKFAIPKKGRLYDKCEEMLKGAGIEFRREPRLDVALCVGLPITLVFLPAADIAKFVGQGDVDIGITGYDVVTESRVTVDKVMDLGFGKCKLCVQAPIIDNIKSVEELAGKRIATSFVNVTSDFFQKYDQEAGTTTRINFVSGSVEAACGLGLADAVVDLVETGTTMKVSTGPVDVALLSSFDSCDIQYD